MLSDARRGACSPVVGVEVPQNGCQTKLRSNPSHTVVKIAQCRAPVERRNARHVFDRLGRVVQLGKHFLVRQGRHELVRPGVPSNVVPVPHATQRTVRPVDNVRANVEHRRLLVVLLQKVIKRIVRAVGAIIKGLQGWVSKVLRRPFKVWHIASQIRSNKKKVAPIDRSGPAYTQVNTYQTPCLWLRTACNITVYALHLGLGALASGPPAVRIASCVVACHVQAACRALPAHRNVGRLGPINRIVQLLELLALVHVVARCNIPDGRPFGLVHSERRLIVLAFSGHVVRRCLWQLRDSNVGRIRLGHREIGRDGGLGLLKERCAHEQKTEYSCLSQHDTDTKD